jgi:hypothetical protein
MENKIGAGLIEEVIQVAEGELKLADVLLKSKVYVLCLTLSPYIFANEDSQMGGSRGEAGREPMDIFHA